MNILYSLFIEELFTPLESERTFAIIESSEPLGTLAAGIITAGGVLMLHLHAPSFLLIWAVLMAVIIPLFILFQKKRRPVPIPKSRKEMPESRTKREKWKEVIGHLRNIPFLKGLLIVIFLQWFAYHLIEFQFTKAVQMEFVAENSGGHGTSSGADALTHGLGRLHIFISAAFLISQLLIANRIMKRYGLIRSIVLHPIASFCGSLFMFYRFTFASAIGMKVVYEIVGGLKRNAYHASFYALRPKIRELAKEFLEGVIRPFGMMLGTLLLYFIQKYTATEIHDYAISGTLLLIFFFMFLEAMSLSRKYTFLAKKNLETQGQVPEKLDAIEILAQKGHIDPAQYLIKSLVFRKEKPEVQAKILKTLGVLRDPGAIPEILKFFDHPDRDVQLAAVRALTHYHDLGDLPSTETFTQHRVVESLKDLILKSPSKKIKSAVIEVFKNLKHKDLVPFLLKLLESSDPKLKSDAIYISGLFNDYSSAYYLEKFLTDPHSRVKSNAIIALWKFLPYRLKLLVTINGMLESGDEDELLSGIYAVGETRMIQEIPRLKKLIEHENQDVKRHAVIAFAKLGQREAIEYVVELILHPEKKISEEARELIQHIDEDMYKAIWRRLTQRISERIFTTLNKEKKHILEDMSDGTLKELCDAYEILGEEHEMMEVKEIIEERAIEKKRLEEGTMKIPHRPAAPQPSGKTVSIDDLLSFRKEN